MKMETLGAVAEYINGRAFKPNEWESTGLPIIRIQNLNDPLAKYNYSSQIFEEKYRVHKGDLLYAWSASLGAHIWKGTDAWLNQHIFHVIPHDNIDQHYLYYFLCKITMELYSKAHGTGMVHITKAPFMTTEIPVPSLPEQERIVARIEELFSELDKAVETLQTTKRQLEIYRQAVLKEAFESSGEWTSYKFKDLMLSVRNGYGIKPTDDGDYKILRISSVRATKLDLSDYRLNNCSFSSEDSIAENDLLFTRYNGSKEFVGVCAVVPRLTCSYGYPDKLIKCTPLLQDSYHSKFIQYYMSQGEARAYIRSKIKTTSGQNGISGSDIKNTQVYLPSIEIQREIVIKIESRLSVCDSIEQTVDSALAQADALRQSILKEAFEGRL